MHWLLVRPAWATGLLSWGLVVPFLWVAQVWANEGDTSFWFYGIIGAGAYAVGCAATVGLPDPPAAPGWEVPEDSAIEATTVDGFEPLAAAVPPVEPGTSTAQKPPVAYQRGWPAPTGSPTEGRGPNEYRTIAIAMGIVAGVVVLYVVCGGFVTIQR
jgi:hypothetical protein